MNCFYVSGSVGAESKAFLKSYYYRRVLTLQTVWKWLRNPRLREPYFQNHRHRIMIFESWFYHVQAWYQVLGREQKGWLVSFKATTTTMKMLVRPGAETLQVIGRCFHRVQSFGFHKEKIFELSNSNILDSDFCFKLEIWWQLSVNRSLVFKTVS